MRAGARASDVGEARGVVVDGVSVAVVFDDFVGIVVDVGIVTGIAGRAGEEAVRVAAVVTNVETNGGGSVAGNSGGVVGISGGVMGILGGRVVRFSGGVVPFGDGVAPAGRDRE